MGNEQSKPEAEADPPSDGSEKGATIERTLLMKLWADSMRRAV